MKNQDLKLWQPRNPVAERLTRRQVFRQITIPLLIATAIVLALIVLSVRLPSAGASLWADIALISLISPAILVTLIFLAITLASAYGVVKLISVLPPFFYKIQSFTRLVDVRIREIGERAVTPVIKLKSMRASVSAGRRSVRRAAQRMVNGSQGEIDEG